MLTVSTYLAPSAIDGLGVFSGEYIERGRLLWSLDPKFDIFVDRSEVEGYPPISRTSSPVTPTRIWRCRGWWFSIVTTGAS